MKIKYILILLTHMSICNVNTFGQWNFMTYFNTFINTWQYDFCDAIFISQDTGVYCYDRWWSPSSGTSIHVDYTNDGGMTWTGVLSDNYQIGISPYGFYNTNSRSHYFYLSYEIGGVSIKRSIDCYDWQNVGGTFGWLRAFSAPDSMNYYCLNYNYVSNEVIIARKYFGGNSETIYSFDELIPNEVFYTDSMHGFIAARNDESLNNYMILKTNSAGSNWDTIFTDTLFSANKIFFPSQDVGYIVGDSCKIIKTNDGGVNWDYLNTDHTSDLLDVHFKNDSVGFICGNNGLIMRTSDGGATWIQDESGVSSTFSKIYFISENLVYALTGQTQLMLDMLLSNQKWNEYKKTNKKLIIYPNPTTEICTIEIPSELGTSKSRSLQIFNQFGRKAKEFELIENQDRINIDCSNLSSGMYILNYNNGIQLYNEKLLIK